MLNVLTTQTKHNNVNSPSSTLVHAASTRAAALRAALAAKEEAAEIPAQRTYEALASTKVTINAAASAAAAKEEAAETASKRLAETKATKTQAMSR